MDKMQTYFQSENAWKDQQDYQSDLQEWNADKLAREVSNYEKDSLILI